jgi:hypothetical protein
VPSGGKIGAMSLPVSLAKALDWPAWSGLAMVGLLLSVAVPRAFRWSYEIQPKLPRLSEAERVFLTIGAALTVGCFLAGRSIDYRAIHLLFVLPALLALAAEADASLARTAVALVLWAMWDDALQIRSGRLNAFLWLVDQCVWWIVVAILSACLLALLRTSPAWTSFWGVADIDPCASPRAMRPPGRSTGEIEP